MNTTPTVRVTLPRSKEGQFIRTIKNGIQVAENATTKETYYSTGDEVKLSLVDAIKKMRDFSCELPLLLANTVNARNSFIQYTIVNELKNSIFSKRSRHSNILIASDDWRYISFKAMLSAMNKMKTSSKYKLLQMLKDEKVNNNRTKRLILSTVFGSSNLEFEIIKYRSKIKEALSHAWGALTLKVISKCREAVDSGVALNSKVLQDIYKFNNHYSNTDLMKLVLFVYGKAEKEDFLNTDFKLQRIFFNAKEDVFSEGVEKLPLEIVTGMLPSNIGERHPQFNELWSTKEKRADTVKRLMNVNKSMTEEQKIRTHRKAREVGAEQKTINVSKVKDFIPLYKRGYELGFTDEIVDAIESLARRKADSFSFEISNVGIILDNSESMLFTTSKESKNTARANAEFTAKVLSYAIENSLVVETGSQGTCLAEGFITVLEEMEDIEAVFVISDGYENSYEGLLGEVLTAYNKEADKPLAVYHVSPVVSGEDSSKIRKLKGVGDQVVSIGTCSPESIQTQIELDTLYHNPKLWLRKAVDKMLG